MGTEYQKDEEAAASVVLFKRGKAPKGITSQLEGGNSDLEAGSSGSSATAVDRDEQADQAADILARPKDVFTVSLFAFQKVASHSRNSGGMCRTRFPSRTIQESCLMTYLDMSYLENSQARTSNISSLN